MDLNRTSHNNNLTFNRPMISGSHGSRRVFLTNARILSDLLIGGFYTFAPRRRIDEDKRCVSILKCRTFRMDLTISTWSCMVRNVPTMQFDIYAIETRLRSLQPSRKEHRRRLPTKDRKIQCKRHRGRVNNRNFPVI